tara:strand:- start:495 stop:629 length:135 start_codon:yes stop_codon:yes gene_type:complete
MLNLGADPDIKQMVNGKNNAYFTRNFIILTIPTIASKMGFGINV